MTASKGYVLCGTPRTGSTFLCSLLAGTGVLGRPESYFRELDEATWAARFGLPTVGQRVQSYRSFLEAVRVAATTENGVFGARIMWGSVEGLVEGVGGTQHGSDLVTLQAAFGTLTFVHLLREDLVGQAVSWARAEQTGYWQQGDTVTRPPELDVRRIVDLVHTIQSDNASWRTWFASNGIEPCTLTYENLTSRPETAVQEIADLVGVVLPPDWQPESPHRRQADRVNAKWSALVRSALGDAPESERGQVRLSGVTRQNGCPTGSA